MTTNTIVIRVPADKFDAAVAELNRMGTVLNKDISAQDVTDQYLDLELRLRNAKATQQKLLALLEKSQAVRDTLEIEKELQRITTEIERLEGQLNKLSHEVAYSMLTVLFNQTKNAPAETQVKLPFYWLGRIGLDELLSF
jgi:predicted nuclease with TOPRIM domain